MPSTKAALIALMGKRYSAADIPVMNSPGLYAFFIDNTFHLLPVKIPDNGLVHVGMTEDNLDARNHFFHASSGFSTLRRSLGAILKTQLSLQAIPRGTGDSFTNCRNYKFTPEGEERLSEWMKQHLTCSYFATGESVDLLEVDVIRTLMPPLNLTHWKNKQAPFIKKLRKECVREAESFSSVD